VPDDERALIEQAKYGDRKAFDRLTKMYLDKAFSIAYSYAGNAADAHDIVQEVFYKVFINLHRFDLNYPFTSWFYRIVTNSSINFSKRRRRKRVMFLERNPKSDMEPLEYLAVSGSNPEKELINEEMRRLLYDGLKKLPEKQRSAIILFDIEGFSQDEVAEILKCPQGSVMSRVFYGRKKMRKLLEKYF
jgi:RNA polymerase sigma-70 factor (ECF subfamily)